MAMLTFKFHFRSLWTRPGCWNFATFENNWRNTNTNFWIKEGIWWAIQDFSTPFTAYFVLGARKESVFREICENYLVSLIKSKNLT